MSKIYAINSKVISYIPNQGDIFYADFDPVIGHEQGGRRPAIVISNGKYNKKTGLCIVSPITSAIKGYVFELELSELQTTGVVLCDQIRTIDWKNRDIQYIENSGVETLQSIIKLQRLIFSI